MTDIKATAKALKEASFSQVTTFVRALRQAKGSKKIFDGEIVMDACDLILNDDVDETPQTKTPAKPSGKSKPKQPAPPETA